ncbi:hypothetical protein D3C76_1400920 [compost metagenome]
MVSAAEDMGRTGRIARPQRLEAALELAGGEAADCTDGVVEGGCGKGGVAFLGECLSLSSRGFSRTI